MQHACYMKEEVVKGREHNGRDRPLVAKESNKTHSKHQFVASKPFHKMRKPRLHSGQMLCGALCSHSYPKQSAGVVPGNQFLACTPESDVPSYAAFGQTG